MNSFSLTLKRAAGVLAAGFDLLAASYRNSLFFPLLVALRLKDKLALPRAAEAHSDLKPLPRSLNAFLTRTLLFENRLILSAIPLPVGLSVICVGRKPSANAKPGS